MISCEEWSKLSPKVDMNLIGMTWGKAMDNFLHLGESCGGAYWIEYEPAKNLSQKLYLDKL